MQKQVLGKSIDSLMKTGKTVSNPPDQTANLPESTKLSSPGLKALISGNNSINNNSDKSLLINNKSPTQENSPATKQKNRNAVLIMLVADLLLVIMAFALVLGKSTAPANYELALCCAAIIIGGILGCWGFLNWFKKT